MSVPTLEIENVSISYRLGITRQQNAPPVVRNVNLTIASRETYGLLGFSGCGKTTLARAVAGLLPLAAGRISIDGKVVAVPGDGAKRNSPCGIVSMVFQDPTGSLNPRMPIGRSIEEPLLYKGKQPKSKRFRLIGAMLERVGLSKSDSSRFPHEFSGGQRQRIAIARALIADPKLVICDEPVSALDLSVQAQIVALLAQLQRERDVSYLFITHNIDLARLNCSRIGVMSAGELVEEGPTAKIITQPSHPATIELLDNRLISPCNPTPPTTLQ